MVDWRSIHSKVLSWERKFARPPFEAIKSIWANFFPTGWKCHGMYLWMLPNESRPYLGHTFSSMPKGSSATLSAQCQRDHRSPKPQLRWSFPQICLRTVASSNQQLHIFSQFPLIIQKLLMPRPTPIDIRHEVLAFACEGIWRSAIAGHIDLTHATVNCILRRHAATGILVPGKSTGAPRKTTPRQDHALLRMLRENRLIGLMPWWRRWSICVEWGLAGKPSTTGSCPVVTDPQGSPCWLLTTTACAWSGHRGGRTWQWPIGSMSSSVTSPGSNFSR